MSSTSGGVSARDLSHISSNLARSALHTVQAEASEQARSTLGEGEAEDAVTELVDVRTRTRRTDTESLQLSRRVPILATSPRSLHETLIVRDFGWAFRLQPGGCTTLYYVHGTCIVHCTTYYTYV